MAVEEARSERVAGAQDIFDLHGITGRFDRLDPATRHGQMNARAVFAPLLEQRAGTQRKQDAHRLTDIPRTLVSETECVRSTWADRSGPPPGSRPRCR